MKKIILIVLTLIIGQVNAQNLPLTFEGGQAPGFGDFNGSVTQIISNPDPTGINTSDNVAQNTVPAGAAFAGVAIGVPVDLTTDKYFKMQIWSSIPNTPVLLKLEGGPAPVQREVTTSTTGAWEELVFDFLTKLIILLKTEKNIIEIMLKPTHPNSPINPAIGAPFINSGFTILSIPNSL